MRLPIALSVLAAATLAAQAPQSAPFEEFVAGLRTEALARGISAATVDKALTGLEPLPIAVERDRTQPEQVISLDTYLSRIVTAKRATAARDAVRTHRETLAGIEQTYGVPRHVLVAVWGIESNFGTFTGIRPTIAALATLAFDGRRPMFRNELFDALKIVDTGHIAPDEMKGSWAGAMGQPQFMPSSYLKYAVDFDRDGRADIWTSAPDVFASIANYLKEFGWTGDQRWGREVKLAAGARTRIDHRVPMRASNCRAEREMTEARPLAEWTTLGVRQLDGRPLPKADLTASLVRGDKRYFLVYPNYGALLSYNCSNSYAVSIGLLSDKIK